MIRTITVTGTKNNQGLILKALSISPSITEVSASPLTFSVSPIIIKIIKVTINVGTVVYAIYFMCVNKSVPAMAGAKFVVSDIGDILSPK